MIDLQKQIDQSNELNLNLQNDLKNLENKFAEERANNDNLRSALVQERDYLDCEDQKFSELSCIRCDKENKIKCLNHDYERMKIVHQQVIELNGIYNNERNKLEEHIMKLNTQNQDLSTEIENVIKDDEHMKSVLSRNERMSFLLSDNDSILAQLPNDITCEKFCVQENKMSSINNDKRLCYQLNSNKIEEKKYSRMNIKNKK